MEYCGYEYLSSHAMKSHTLRIREYEHCSTNEHNNYLYLECDEYKRECKL